MSAIWGMIGARDNVALTGRKMDGAMSRYKLDRVDFVEEAGVYLACGHQHITPESFSDVSPIVDEKKNIYFTGDIFLTNRGDIIKELGRDDSLTRLGDCALVYRLYEEKGDKFIDFLRGSFAIVIYNRERNEVKLYADHFSRRYLAYCFKDGTFCFGSVYTPIFAALGGRPEINEECLAQVYMDMMPTSFKAPEMTVYKDIYHVGPAECVTVNPCTGEKTRENYYQVGKNVKKLHLKSDEEYKKLFLDTYRATVNSLIRENPGEQVAIQLSGGLDSSSVAALAAERLQNEEKNLYAFSVIPASGYDYVNTCEVIENEQPTVEAQKRKHPNIVTDFVNGDEGCAFTDLKKYTGMFEFPVTTAMNIGNIVRIYEKAGKAGCRFILSGANGNASISYGEIFYYISEKLKRLQPGKAYKEIKAYCKLRNISRKKLVEVYIKGVLDDLLSPGTVNKTCMLNDEIMKKYDIATLARRKSKARGGAYIQNKAQRIRYGYNTTLFQHMGLFETYSSLVYGILAIDPTLTVEMVELSFSMPIDTQVKNGRERCTIRTYMEDMLPICVTSEDYGRGIQAADAEFRVKRDWESVRESVMSIMNDPKLLTYLDETKLAELIKLVEKGNGDMDRKTLIESVGVCTLGCFLKSFC